MSKLNAFNCIVSFELITTVDDFTSAVSYQSVRCYSVAS